MKGKPYFKGPTPSPEKTFCLAVVTVADDAFAMAFETAFASFKTFLPQVFVSPANKLGLRSASSHKTAMSRLATCLPGPPGT